MHAFRSESRLAGKGSRPCAVDGKRCTGQGRDRVQVRLGGLQSLGYQRGTGQMKCVIVFLGVVLSILAGGCASGPGAQRQECNMISRFAYKDVSIAYREEGQGPPVILLHGLGGAMYTWRHLVPALASDHKVVTLDFKGFGLSDKPRNGDYSIQGHSEMVEAFIRERGYRDVTLIGNSMGGAVTLLTCLNCMKKPDNPIGRLVLIDSAAYLQDIPLFIQAMRIPVLGSLYLYLVPPRIGAGTVLKIAYFDPKKIPEESKTTYGGYLSMPGAREALIRTSSQLIPKNMDELAEQYKSIDVPTLIIWGDHDRIVPLWVGKKLSWEIPRAEMKIIKDCGHIPQEECPEEVIPAISEFLAEHQQQKPGK